MENGFSRALGNTGFTVDTFFGMDDFGFSTFIKSRTSEGGELESIVAPGGTVGFAAPEQISPAFGEIGFTTDIYAIGGLAYYLLTGQSPHNPSSLLDTVTDEDLILPNNPATSAEAKLIAVAKFALKKAISSRPQTVTELVPLLACRDVVFKGFGL